MYLLYSILMVSWGILLIPVFLYKAWRRQKFLPGCVSGWAGYLRICAARHPYDLVPLLLRRRNLECAAARSSVPSRFPQARFVFSTVTNTGQSIAKQRFSIYGEANTFFFPIDLASVAKRVLDFVLAGHDNHHRYGNLAQCGASGVEETHPRGSGQRAHLRGLLSILPLGSPGVAQGLSKLPDPADEIRRGRAAHPGNGRSAGQGPGDGKSQI